MLLTDDMVATLPNGCLHVTKCQKIGPLPASRADAEALYKDPQANDLARNSASFQTQPYLPMQLSMAR